MNLSTVNSKYDDSKQLNSLEIDLPPSNRLFHVNIASLLNYNYHVIGISDHKIMKDTNNIKISG